MLSSSIHTSGGCGKILTNRGRAEARCPSTGRQVRGFATYAAIYRQSTTGNKVCIASSSQYGGQGVLVRYLCGSTDQADRVLEVVASIGQSDGAGASVDRCYAGYGQTTCGLTDVAIVASGIQGTCYRAGAEVQCAGGECRQIIGGDRTKDQGVLVCYLCGGTGHRHSPNEVVACIRQR